MAENQDYLLYESIQDYLQDYLNQIYTIDCLVKMSRQIVDNERAIRKAIEESDSFVAADAWIKSAKDALARFDKHHTPPEDIAVESDTTNN